MGKRLYAIGGTVETIVIRGEPEMRGLVVTPPFYVRAASANDARVMAGKIIDPLMMTGLRTITVRRIKRKEARRWTR